jgi:inner membrane protein
MDPVTQGALGAVLPQTIAKKALVGRAALFGFLAGMAADLDVLIRSDEDPLLFLEYHRQFTHSLIFIPIGGMLVGLVLYSLIGKRWNLSAAQSILFCTLGYATHALLDACTSYGTQLFWPFSNERFAWHAISIIDPLFTIPLLAGIIWASIKQKPVFAQVALIWAVFYMSLSIFQRDAAMVMGQELAASRGHTVERIEVKPSFANLLVWKSVYETPDTTDGLGRFYIDAVAPTFSKKVFVGRSLAKLDVAKDFSWLAPESQQAKDIERFRWFSNGYVAAHPAHPNQIIDVRYSMVPNEIAALWSIELSPTAMLSDHVKFLTDRGNVKRHAQKLWAMITD